MIVTALITLFLTPFKLLLEFIISLLPTTTATAGSMINVVTFLKKGLWFFDYNFFCSMLSVIIIFVTLKFVWAVVEWIYIKIPGVN